MGEINMKIATMITVLFLLLLLATPSAGIGHESTHNVDVVETDSVTDINFLSQSVYQAITHNLFITTAALSVAVSPGLLSSSTQSLRITSFYANQSMATNYTDKAIAIGNATIANATIGNDTAKKKKSKKRMKKKKTAAADDVAKKKKKATDEEYNNPFLYCCMIVALILLCFLREFTIALKMCFLKIDEKCNKHCNRNTTINLKVLTLLLIVVLCKIGLYVCDFILAVLTSPNRPQINARTDESGSTSI